MYSSLFKISFATIFCFMLCVSSFGQTKILMTNATSIDSKKYADYKGSPYFFADWADAVLYDRQNKAFEGVKIRFDGLENEMEVTTNMEKSVTVEPREYPEIIIKDVPEIKKKSLDFLDKVAFVYCQACVTPGYYLELIDEVGLQLLVSFSVSESTIVQRPPGKIIEIKRLRKNETYVLIENGKVSSFTSKKSSLKKALAHKGNIVKWAKKNKMKLKDHSTIYNFIKSQE